MGTVLPLTEDGAGLAVRSRGFMAARRPLSANFSELPSGYLLKCILLRDVFGAGSLRLEWQQRNDRTARVPSPPTAGTRSAHQLHASVRRKKSLRERYGGGPGGRTVVAPFQTRETQRWLKQPSPTGARRSARPPSKRSTSSGSRPASSCDGDSVSITAATQPSIEDVVLGAIPGLPKVHLHNPVLAYEVGDDFMKYWYRGRAGRARPVRPRRRRLDPQREDQEAKATGRRWAPTRDRPADHDLRVDRPAGAQGAGPWSPPAPAPPTAAFTPWQGNPTGCMGLADYLGWNWKSKAGLPIVNVPGCPVQPDNFMETLLYLLYQAAGLAPMIPLDEQLRPTWLFGKTVHEGCDRGGYYEQADFAAEYGSPKCIVKLGCWGPVVQLQRRPSAAGWPASAAARTSAASASAARCPASPTSSCRSWTSRPARTLSTTAVGVYGRIDPRAARHHQRTPSTRSRSGGTAAAS